MWPSQGSQFVGPFSLSPADGVNRLSEAVKRPAAARRKVPLTHSMGNVMGNSQSANLQAEGEEPGDLQPSETALRSEVAFWREMIGARSEALPAEAVERMHHALALAEHRIVALYGRRNTPDVPRVIDLAAARRKMS
jgi:hypothetical protein